MIRTLSSLMIAVNRLPIWKRQVRMGNYAMQVTSFDRWLYVKLQAFRLMGDDERDFLSRHVTPGMTVLDIGANIGLYSILFADLVGKRGKVFGFEPDPLLFETAIANIRRNGKEGVVELKNLALGSKAGNAVLYRSSVNAGDNRLSASPAHPDAVDVKIARLDDVLDGVSVDLVKMDVQGWEAEVLRGMEKILKRNPGLMMYFEYWPEGLRRAGENPLSPINILQQSGFTVFYPGKHEPLTTREIENLPTIYAGSRYINLLAKQI